MLEFLLYFFASVGVISVASVIFFSWIARRERRLVDKSDLDNYK